MISYYLAQTPPQPALDSAQDQHLILDGTFLRRPGSLVAVMDAKTHRLITGRYGISESSEPQLTAFLQELRQGGLRPRSFTVDGNPTVMRVLRKLWPDVTVQRCLVHIQRQGLSWCRSHPKTTYARKLRRIFLKITHIQTARDQDEFARLWATWEASYGARLSQQPEKGPVFSDIKRARSMLLRALPDMFHYLDDPLVPISTNGLEGYFSRLKARYRQHRGLGTQRRASYFNWYFYFNPK